MTLSLLFYAREIQCKPTIANAYFNYRIMFSDIERETTITWLFWLSERETSRMEPLKYLSVGHTVLDVQPKSMSDTIIL